MRRRPSRSRSRSTANRRPRSAPVVQGRGGAGRRCVVAVAPLPRPCCSRSRSRSWLAPAASSIARLVRRSPRLGQHGHADRGRHWRGFIMSALATLVPDCSSAAGSHLMRTMRRSSSSSRSCSSVTRLEARATRQTGAALRALIALRPAQARVERNGAELESRSMPCGSATRSWSAPASASRSMA